LFIRMALMMLQQREQADDRYPNHRQAQYDDTV
jgi:hypothetical protein